MSAGRTALASGEGQCELWPDAAVERLRFRRAPLLAAAILFALGVVLARSWQPAVVLLIALALLVGMTWFGLRRRAWASVIAVAGVWVVVGLWCAEIQPAVKSQQALLAYTDGLSRTVRGRVIRVRELPRKARNRMATPIQLLGSKIRAIGRPERFPSILLSSSSRT